MKLKRRKALQTGGAVLLGAVAGCGRDAPDDSAAVAQAPALKRRLNPDSLGLFALPDGFHVQVLQRTGERMSDGYRVPGRPDAMACFRAPNGAWVLMRNHELLPDHFSVSAYDEAHLPPPEAYDRNGLGGVSRVVLDPGTLAVKSSNLVLTGTNFNCAGGVSPWGWLSCEENVAPEHGYVFLCATDADKIAKPHRIDAYGRMSHEAATVDPRTSIAYLTEDRPDACFYRFKPSDPAKPFEGVLQALKVRGRERVDTGALRQGTRVEVDWIDLPSPPDDDSIRELAQERGAAIIRRGEGLWLTERDVFFSATIGGRQQRGQILRLELASSTLEVLAEGDARNALEMPDNLTISPHGLIYVCEDGMEGSNSLRTLSLDGRMVEFARYLKPGSELAGACFSPDGRVLFVNAQEHGLTLAITGPFEREIEIHAAGATAHAALPSLRGGLAYLALAALTRSLR